MRAEGLSKTFGAVRALRDVSLSIGQGEVRGLVGGNGSGKSTFVKIIAGYHLPDGGRVEIGGEDFSFGAGEAPAGCRFVHQDLGLIPEMTVAENLGFGGSGQRSLAPIRGGAEKREIQGLLDRYELPFSPGTSVTALSPAERTMVALVRALHCQGEEEVRLLVLDEATATLPKHEIDEVFAAVRKVIAGGASVIFVSHKLAEVLEICDEVTVFRDGALADTVSTGDLDEDDLVELIVGRPLTSFYVQPKPSGEAVALSARGLYGGSIRGVDLNLHQREIVGVTSIDPAEPSRLLRLLYGIERRRGSIEVDGEPIEDRRDAHAMIERGVSLVAGRSEGGIGSFKVRENLTLNDIGFFMRRGLLSGRGERAAAEQLIERFDIRPPHPEADFSALSGGNQQKVVLAKSMGTGPRVLLLDDPTQGVDIGAKATLYRILREAAADGLAILIGSTDIEELCGVCHRVVVLRDGRVGGLLEADGMTPEAVLERCYVDAATPQTSLEKEG